MNEEMKIPEITPAQTIGEIVASDYRTAEVFGRYGIDFCCGGNVTLESACRGKGIELPQLRRELEQASSHSLDRGNNYAAWDLPFLADYIVNMHHNYLKENMASIAAYAHKIAEVHGSHHPEVVEIAGIFDKIAADLRQHLREEEEVLFPAIKSVWESAQSGTEKDAGAIEVLKESLDALGHEHDEVGAAIHTIRALAKNFVIPEDVCNTFMLTYKKLEEFEEDLHKHVHLENNILFPKAAKL